MISRSSGTSWGLVLASAMCLAGYGGLARLDASKGTLRDQYVSQTIGWYLVAFAGFIAAVWWNERHPIGWSWLWVGALIFRVLMLTTSPTLSDDVYRYLWEGHVAIEGISPYSYAIDDPQLDSIEIPARGLANNPGLSSPYLPAAHAVFATSAATLPSEPLSIQLVMTIFELVGAALLVVLLRFAGLPRNRVILWLWNPLVIVEVAHGAHLDALMVTLVLAAVALTVRPGGELRIVAALAAPVLLALATLTRPLPLLLAPVLFWRWSLWQRLVYGLSLVIVVLPFGLASGFGFADQMTGVFGSARAYADTFRFNSAIYQPLEDWIGGRGLDSEGWNEPRTLTRLLVGAVFLAIVTWTWIAARQRQDVLSLLRLASVPLGAYVLLTPVLHPWYVLLFVAFLVFLTPAPGETIRRWMFLAPWGWLFASLVLSYLTYEDPSRFAEVAWVRRVEWWPTLVLVSGGGLALGTSCWKSWRQ